MPVTPPTPIDALPTPPSTSDPANFDSRADAFLGSLPAFRSQTNTLATNVFDNATDAAASATAANTKAGEAAASALTALNAPGTSATVAGSISIGAGNKSFTLDQLDKAFVVGMPVRIARSGSAATNWMQGIITAFTPGTGAMTVNVTSSAGSGSAGPYTVSVTGPEALPVAAAGDVQAGTSNSSAVSPQSLRLSAAFQTLTDGATISWDTALGYNARVTLGGNRAMAAPTNLRDGLTYTLLINQGAVGNRTLTWDSVFDWGEPGAPVLSTGANKVDFAFGTYSSFTGKLHMTFRRAA